MEFRPDSGGIPSEFQKVFTTKFTRILLKFYWKIRTNFLAETNWNSDGTPVVLQGYSGRIPAEYHWNSPGLTSEETGKIPADFQQKLTGNLPEYR